MHRIPQRLRLQLARIILVPALLLSARPSTSAQQGAPRGLDLPAQPAGRDSALVIDHN
jgi:hypothetical protein